MRRILLVVGSARKDGNTARLAQAFMSGATEAGHEVRMVVLGNDIRGCRGCGFCQRSDKGCVIHDVMDEVYPLYDWCDTIVIASPLFFGSISGQTKSFLDRLYAKGRDDRYQRRGTALLMTAEMSKPEAFDQARRFFEIIAAVHGSESLGTYFAGGCNSEPGTHDIPSFHLDNAREFGRSL